MTTGVVADTTSCQFAMTLFVGAVAVACHGPPPMNWPDVSRSPIVPPEEAPLPSFQWYVAICVMQYALPPVLTVGGVAPLTAVSG